MVNVKNVSQKEHLALSRIRQILSESGLMRASLVILRNTCGKAGCRCMKSKRFRHISWYACQSQKGKPRKKLVPADKLSEVRQWIERYNEVKELLEQISEEYWKRLGKPRKRRS